MKQESNQSHCVYISRWFKSAKLGLKPVKGAIYRRESVPPYRSLTGGYCFAVITLCPGENKSPFENMIDF